MTQSASGWWRHTIGPSPAGSGPRAWPVRPRWSPRRIRRRLFHRGVDEAGDGRERALVAHVLATTRPGDLDAVIDAIDRFAYRTAFLISIGDRKGAILDAAVQSARPQRLLELGTYIGYSALRIARVMPPGARLYSIERGRANADIATRIWRHAGIADRVACVTGWLGDRGATLARLHAEHGFAEATTDFLFIDHDKNAYLPDLKRLLDHGWLRDGAIVVADNVLNPGAPDYRAYMREHEGTLWQTTEHPSFLEYHEQSPDLMLTSRYRRTPHP